MAVTAKTVTVKFDGTTKGLVSATAEAKAQVKAFQKTLDDGKKSWANFGSAAGAAAGNLVRLAGSVARLSVGVNLVAAIGQALITASGAAPLAVAGVMGLSAALITTKLGADGIKKAFDGLTPSLNNLKTAVSASFEQSLTPAVNNLKSVLPRVTTGFKEIATAMGGVLTRITAWLNTSAAVSQVNVILDGTSRIIQNIGKLIQPVIAAFVRIGAVAIPILVGLTTNLGNVGQSFNDWIQRMADTGNITQWLNDAVSLFRSLFSTLKDVGSIAASVFGALEDSGAGLTGVLNSVVGAVKDFVQSAQGHDTIVALAQAVQQVGQAVGAVLGAALRAVGPAIPNLAKAFGDLATQVSAILIPVINRLAPILVGISGFVSDNIGWLGKLAIAIAGIGLAIRVVTAAYEAWRVVTSALTVVQWALDAALLANPVGLLVAAILAAIAAVAALVVGFVLLWNKSAGFRDFWIGIWKAIQSAAGAVADFFVSSWGHIVDFFESVGYGIVDAFRSVLSWFQALPGRIGSFLSSLPGIVGNALLTALKSAANAAVQGLEWVIAEFIALPLQIAFLLDQLQQILANAFTAAFKWALNAVVTGAEAVYDFVTAVPGAIGGFLASLPGILANLASNAWTWFLNTATSVVNGLFGFVQSIPGSVAAGLSALGGLVAGVARDAWSGFVNGSISAANALWGFVQSIPGRVVGALGDLGSLLVGAGKAVINGFLNGLKAAIGGVWSFVGGIADKVAALKGPLPYDRRLLIPAGNAIMNGFREGLVDGFGSVQNLVSGMADRVQGTFGKQLNVSATGSIATAARNLTGQQVVSALAGPSAPAPQAPEPTRTINLTLDLGSGIQQAVQIQLDSNNRAVARAISMGVGASR